MSDNPDTFTTVERDAGSVIIEIFCATAEAAQNTIRLISVAVAEGRQVHITLPNVRVREDVA